MFLVLFCTWLCFASSRRIEKSVPMVHQNWDVPDWFNGSWAGGPSSAVMALSYFGLLEPVTINLTQPTPHSSDYGWYVPSNYITEDGTVMDHSQPDPAGTPAYGAYGWTTNGGGAVASQIVDYLKRHEVALNYSDSSSYDVVKHAIDAGHVVILDTRLLGAGHIIMVVGYDDTAGSTLICNDPLGDATHPDTYGQKLDGASVKYTWDSVGARWMIEVGEEASQDVVNLKIVMIHQRWDVPEWYDGSWGCGPTSATMAISYFKKLNEQPIFISKPENHTNSYGWYLPNKFVAPDGTNIDREQPDASGNPCWGGFGWCTDGGGAIGARMSDYVKHMNLHGDVFDSSSLETVKAALDKGHPVVLDTRLSSAGHLILVRGYDFQDRIVCNDPYGNAQGPSWGHLRDGENVHYPFDFVKARWMMEVYE